MKIQKLNKEISHYDNFNRDYNVSYNPHKSGTYRIEIDDVINDVSQFSTAIQALQMAEEHDDVEIHLQCAGGNVDASGAFLHAMRKCRANIHIVASGGVHSAGTHILLEGDSFELAANFNSLIHNGSSGSIGNLNEYHSKSDFDKGFLRKQYFEIYEGFLSQKEFDDIMAGQNLWLDAEAWVTRAEARSKYFIDKIEESKKPKRKVKAAPKEGSITKEEAKKAVQVVIDAKNII